MTSTVYFRMFHGKDPEPINFTGQGIRLLDLKRQIVEKKNMKTGLDFDLEVTDANTNTVYKEDDGLVPKNVTVVVKRKPAAAGTGLLSKLAQANTRGSQSSVDITAHDIIIPLKAETMEHDFKQESVINTSNTNGNLVSTSASSLDNTEYASSGMTAEDEAEMEAINAINSRAAYLGSEMSAQLGGPGSRGGFMRGGRGRGRDGAMLTSNSMPPLNYVCFRCKKSGHYIQFCPTNNDPEYEMKSKTDAIPLAAEKVHGIASSVRTKVKDLSGIDTTGKLVIQNKDGSGYEILAPSAAEYDQLVKEGGAAIVDLSRAPPHIKCPLSQALLLDAVLLPCCRKVVSDAFVRQELLSKNLKCPSCGTERISPDELRPVPEVRREAQNFLSGKTGEPQPTHHTQQLPPPPFPPGPGQQPGFPPPPGPPQMMYPGPMHGMGPMGAPFAPPFMPFNPFMPPPMPMWGDYPRHLFPPPLTRDEFLAEQQLQQQRKAAWDAPGDGWLFQRPERDGWRDRDERVRKERDRRERSPDRSRDRATRRDSDKDADKRADERSREERDRDRERDKEREKLRDRDRERDREKEREREKEKEKERERDRERQRERDRQKDRDREREKDKDRGRKDKGTDRDKEKEKSDKGKAERREKASERPDKSGRDDERASKADVGGDKYRRKRSTDEDDKGRDSKKLKTEREGGEGSREDKSISKRSSREERSDTRDTGSHRDRSDRRRSPSPLKTKSDSNSSRSFKSKDSSRLRTVTVEQDDAWTPSYHTKR